MHTMQVQPERCRGCLVVGSVDGSSASTALSPKTAAVAKASKPEGSSSSASVTMGLSLIFLFFTSGV